MKKLLTALLVWLGFDSAMDQKRRGIGVFDFTDGQLIAVVHHRVVVNYALYKLNRKLGRIPDPALTPPVLTDDAASAAAMESAAKPTTEMMSTPPTERPTVEDLESFEFYMRSIAEKADGDQANPVLDSLLAANREVIDLFGIDMADDRVFRSAMMACYAISGSAAIMQRMNQPWPPPYVLSDQMAVSLLRTRESTVSGKMPEDLPDPFGQEEPDI